MTIAGPWVQPADQLIEPAMSLTTRQWNRREQTTNGDPDWATHTSRQYILTRSKTQPISEGRSRDALGFWSVASSEASGYAGPPSWAYHEIVQSAIGFATVRALGTYNPLVSTRPPDAVGVEYESNAGVWHGPCQVTVKLETTARTLGTTDSQGTFLNVPENRSIFGRVVYGNVDPDSSALVQESVSLPAVSELESYATLLELTDDNSLDTASVVSTASVVADTVFAFGAIIEPFFSRANPASVATAWTGDSYGMVFNHGARCLVSVRRAYTPPRWRAIYNRAPYTIRAGIGAGATRFHEGGRHGL